MHALLLLVSLSFLLAADKPPSPKGVFLGTFQVPAARRAEIVRTLNEGGFKGTFIPEDAAPETLLYRADRAEYERALRVVSKLLEDPEAGLRGPVKPSVRLRDVGGARSDDVIFGQLGLSPAQKEKLDALRKEMAEASARLKTLRSGHIEEGLKINRAWRGGLAQVLNKDQLQRYYDYWGAPLELREVPK